MTDPGDAGYPGAAPPHFIAREPGGEAGTLPAPVLSPGALDVEALWLGSQAMPAQSSAGGSPQGAGELDDRRQARLAPGPLQQRDLGAVQLAAIAQLFLGDPTLVRALRKLAAKRSWGLTVGDSSGLTTGTLQTESFAQCGARASRFRYLARGIGARFPEYLRRKH